MWNLWKVLRAAPGAGPARATLAGLALAVVVLVPGRAQAGNNIVASADSLVLLPNNNTVNFTLKYGGDDDQDAVVAVRYWRTSSPIRVDDGVNPMRWHQSGQIRSFAGKLFWLSEGESYTIELAVTDPDGGNVTIQQAVTTRAAAGHGATGPQIWVSPSGNDANSGFNQAAPKQTIASALGAINTGNYPGAQIRLLPGIYYESNSVTQSGTAANPYSIVGHGDPDTVIIAGNDPSLLSMNWSRHGQSPVYKKKLSTPLPPIGLVVAGWGQRLHVKTSLDTLLSPAPNQPQQGWYLDPASRWLYVRLEGGADPNGLPMHMGVRRWALRFEADYWRAESLTVRFHGQQNDAGDGFHLGHWDLPVKELTFRNCTFWTNAGRGITGNRFASEVLIDACRVEDGRVGTWGYFAGKNHAEEHCEGLSFAHGRRWILRGSTIRNVFNGIGVWGDSLDAEQGAASDFHDNTIEKIADDGLEFDCGHGKNLALWGNYIQTGTNGLSLVPTFQGPVYVIYNVFARCNEGAHKQGSIGGPGQCGIASDATGYFYHNTHFIDSTTPFAVTYNSRGAHKNRRYLNNIMMGSGHFPVVYDHVNGGDAATCSFDYDLLWRPNADTLWIWGGVKYSTIAAVRSGLGWELNGKYQQPLFVNSALNDFQPTASSPAVDMGTLIKGINTPHKTLVDCQRRYCNVPDAGAFEYWTSPTCGSGCDTIPPAATSALNSSGGCDSIYVSWFATGDDGNSGTATLYDLRWSDNPITTDAAFNSADPVPVAMPTPGPPTTNEKISIYMGNCSPHKYFALKIRDDDDNWSSLTSDPYGAQTACVTPPQQCFE